MADVRSLLRNERASRRITHPSASYSSTGTLSCLICHAPLKSESLWDTHLKSKQHLSNLQRLASDPSSLANGVGVPNRNKKRKAEEEGEGEVKRPKGPDVKGLPEGFFDNDAEAETLENNPVVEEDEEVKPDPAPSESIPPSETEASPPPNNPPPSTIPSDFFDDALSHPTTHAPVTAKRTTQATSSTALPPVDEDEWAAFERDIALSTDTETLPPPPSANPASTLLCTPASISAPALSAAELAQRATEETNARQRVSDREADVAAEKEDAARRVEEEFDEMEGLEERVNRLKERREGLRGVGGKGGSGVKEDDEGGGGGGDGGSLKGEVEEVVQDDGDDDDDDDDWDDWTFKPS
ncbi:MAG: hypothetical protein M1817_003178 [Caeruleum heppii]|nr:MAG: hypothetical protein M1817_003178 [Caeruleum heppii]